MEIEPRLRPSAGRSSYQRNDRQIRIAASPMG
jgi:hypothetical protein